jgi:thiol-disulfide isomerase/thioredoxin
MRTVIRALLKYLPAISMVLNSFPSFAISTNPKTMSAIVRIRVYYPEVPPGDQLILYAAAQMPVSSNFDSGDYKRYLASRVGKGMYSFAFRLTENQKKTGLYIVLNEFDKNNVVGDPESGDKALAPSIILDHYFLQNGDDITIVVKRKKGFHLLKSPLENYNLKFLGRGALKNTVRNQIDSILYNRDFSNDYIYQDSTYNPNNGDNTAARHLLQFLRRASNRLDHQACKELKIHTVFACKSFESIQLAAYLREHYSNASVTVRNAFFNKFETADTDRWMAYKRVELKASYDFWIAQCDKYIVLSFVKYGSQLSDSLVNAVAIIKDPDIREKLILYVLKNYQGRVSDASAFIRSAAKYMISPEAKDQFAQLCKVENGQQAFNFNLSDANGTKVQLSDFKGKAVFIDFWYTGCGNCINYYTDVLSKVEEQFKTDSNVVFVTISIDKKKEFWLNSVHSGKYCSPKGTNLYTGGEGIHSDVISFYGVFDYPRPLIVDRKQRIFTMGGILRNEQALVDALEKAKN